VTSITQAAIRAATLRAHHVDFFKRDLATNSLSYTVSSTAYLYDFANISSSLARLRSIQLVQGVDNVTYTPVENFEYREISDLYDNDGNRREHMYTLLGNTLRLYPSLATGLISVYYFQNPVVSSVGYSSWIADDYPDELAMWAAAIVFARTGFAEMAADFQKTHIQSFKEMLVASQLLGTVN
jgi:hypothetical protein